MASSRPFSARATGLDIFVMAFAPELRRFSRGIEQEAGRRGGRGTGFE
jgi:hypothetical protein